MLTFAAGVVAGLVAYIISNSLDWFLNNCEDASQWLCTETLSNDMHPLAVR